MHKSLLFSDHAIETSRFYDLENGRSIELRSIPRSSRELLMDIKLDREMSRSGALLLACVRQLMPDILSTVALNPKRFGVYCALEPCDVPASASQQMALAEPQNLSAIYHEFCIPKQHLKSLSPLQAAQVGVALGSRGPVHTFQDLAYGCEHALEQALADLQDSICDFALVATARANDEDATYRAATLSAAFPLETVFREGAASFVIDSSALTKTNSFRSKDKIGSRAYGICQPIFDYLTESH